MTDSRAPFLTPTDLFIRRHIGPGEEDMAEMLDVIGVASIDELVDQTIPPGIRLGRELDLEGPRTESEALDYLKRLNDRYEKWISGYDEGKLLIINADEIDFESNPEDMGKVVSLVQRELHGLF